MALNDALRCDAFLIKALAVQGCKEWGLGLCPQNDGPERAQLKTHPQALKILAFGRQTAQTRKKGGRNNYGLSQPRDSGRRVLRISACAEII
jgi:hypothetical protein